MENARRYLVGCALAAMVIVVALALFMVAVDPYRAFGSPTIQGVNALKPRAAQQGSVAKSRIIARLHPRTLLLGNSRVEVGLDPQSPVWPEPWQPVVNAAQAGTGLDIALCRLNEAIDNGKPHLVVLGIDIQDFLVRETPQRAPAHPSNGQKDCDTDTALWRSMISIDSVMDSVLTVLDQDPRTGATMNADGFNPARDNEIYVGRIGYEGLFAAKIASYRKDYATKPAPTFDHQERYVPFRNLGRIMRLTTAGKIRLVIFVHPYHAQYLDMLKDLHFWPSFEAWKRQVYALVEAENRGRIDPIHVLDFSGYNEISTEAAPPKGGGDTRWYWEPGHYKKALGDRIIQAIVQTQEEGGDATEHTTINLAQKPNQSPAVTR